MHATIDYAYIINIIHETTKSQILEIKPLFVYVQYIT